MKRYQLAIIQPVGPPPPPERLGPIMRDVAALTEEVRAAGALVFSGGLAPPAAARVVRVQAGATHLTDGPYAETKELVGGVLIVSAPDDATALAWAERLARATTLPVEVRAFVHAG